MPFEESRYFRTRKSLIFLTYIDRALLALGLEGSANKLGAGIIRHAPNGSSLVLSNIRHTYVTPPGEGFQPRDTALHHRDWALKIITECLETAGVSISDLDCICYTKGKDYLRLVSTLGCKFSILKAQAWGHLFNL